MLGMLAVLLTILMTGPYACMKIDMINKYPVYKESNGKKTAGNDFTNSDEIIICPMLDMPSFPGGEDSLSAYLRNNIHYPASASVSGICGNVFISFLVTETGNIAEVKVVKGIGSGCDEEAMRVVRNMPAWVPAKQAGKAVATNFNLPIKFILSD